MKTKMEQVPGWSQSRARKTAQARVYTHQNHHHYFHHRCLHLPLYIGMVSDLSMIHHSPYLCLLSTMLISRSSLLEL
jgi:hypothetical protein